jgi:hypothetical protein
MTIVDNKGKLPAKPTSLPALGGAQRRGRGPGTYTCNLGFDRCDVRRLTSGPWELAFHTATRTNGHGHAVHPSYEPRLVPIRFVIIVLIRKEFNGNFGRLKSPWAATLWLGKCPGSGKSGGRFARSNPHVGRARGAKIHKDSAPSPHHRQRGHAVHVSFQAQFVSRHTFLAVATVCRTRFP